MDRFLRPFLFTLLLTLGPATQAENIFLSLGEVYQSLNSTSSSDTGNVLANKIQQELNALNLSWKENDLQYTLSERNIVLDSSCTYGTTLDRIDGNIILSDTSNFNIEITALDKPLVFSISLPLDLAAQGRVEQTFGVRPFRNCIQYGEDGFDFLMTGNAAVKVELQIQLNPQIRSGELILTPEFTVLPVSSSINYRIDVDDTLIDDTIESLLRDEIDKVVSTKEIDISVNSLADTLRNAVIETWGGPDISVTLPELDDSELAELGYFLQRDLALPLTQDQLRSSLPQLLLAVLTDDTDTLETVITNTALCEAANASALPLNAQPLYQLQGGQCQSIDPITISTADNYFSDNACSQVMHYSPTDIQSYCDNTLDSFRVGDGSLIDREKTVWSLSPGTRLDLGVWSTKGKQQPYSTSAVYKSVETETGECQLEMRIYTPHPGQQQLQPLISLHGGSWQYRNSGIAGVEMQMAHYSQEDFIVFAPFYRVAGERSAPVACQNASADQITQDVSDALDWVKTHGSEYGAADSQAMVTGQSAGGQLAAWLAVHRADDIARALLLYPATDVSDYLAQYQSGALGESPEGLDALGEFLEIDIDNPDLSNPLIADNSFPQIVADNPRAYPPMFIIHGASDTLVPARQSQRLCNSLGGDPTVNATPTAETGDVKQVIPCDDRGSQLHLITQGDHILDLCVFSLWCPAGDKASQAATRDSLALGIQWLKTSSADTRTAVAGAAEIKPTDSGGGALLWFLVLGLLKLRSYRKAWNSRHDDAPIQDAFQKTVLSPVARYRGF